MSAPKVKADSGARAKKGETPSTNGSGNGVPSDVTVKATTGSGKPDKVAYDAEQVKIKTDIDALQVKLSAVREKISLVTKSGTGNERRNALRAEMDEIRGQQSNSKNSRGKILDQLKALQDGVQKKTKDLQTARGKTPFRTVEDVDAHIRNLDKQVESGNLKLADEKRALQEINQSKRIRKTVEGFQADIDSIEADRATMDELRKQLDDPELKAVSERYDELKAEMEELQKEGDELYSSRNKLFDERNALQTQLDTLYNQKRDSNQQYREANDRYWAKVNEDKARRAERARAQRAAEEAQKKKELAERLREEAEQPAFQLQIEDCQTLIDYFSGKSGAASSTSSSVARVGLVEEPNLEIRKVDSAPADGMVIRKKKGEDDKSYFVGGKGKGKGKKGNAKASSNNAAEANAPASKDQLNVPLSTLSALLSLSIPPPTSSADIPRVVEDLKKKKAWFEANQARVTAEQVAKAEADIQRLTRGKIVPVERVPLEGDVSPPNGGGEYPPEPSSTPASQDPTVIVPPSQDVEHKLEDVKEELDESEEA
ncbi:hypothetical protein EWM64_g407 [Hericium alpestre]|uniref:Nuclear segregation protein Bfr1 n=1 Tax=Hericium alpestre TaxID=135208 RepID=A0A4Z0AB97_9AGAM|nr:hypothetical protein EWM64_g407 [Hericium alpestre]